MKPITYETPFREIVEVLLKARTALESGALGNLDRLNFGNTRSWIEEAIRLLPEDTLEGGVVWFVEERESDVQP